MTDNTKLMNEWMRRQSGYAPQQQPLQQPQPKAIVNAGAGTGAAPLPTPPTVNDWLRAEAGFDTGRIYK